MRSLTSRVTLAVATAASLATVAAGVAPTAQAGTSGTRSAAVRSVDAQAPEWARALGLSADQGLTTRSVVRDADGTTHAHFDRTYQGLRVVGGDLVVTRSAAGAVKRTAFAGPRSVSVGTSAVVGDSAARRAAAADVAGGRATGSEKVVFLTDAGAYRLAHEVVVEGVAADQTPFRYRVYVDARTGAVLAKENTIHTGTGNSEFSGTVTLGTTGSAGAYQLKDSLGHATYDLRHATTGTGTLLTDADDVWGDGSGASVQTAGVDAHYGAEKTYYYYLTQQGRKGIWDTGKGAPSRVHYGNAYANAFWDGTQMTYGDGSDNVSPLTELDVAAHEMSHGVTENTAGLVYRGDAGGLNEATSDIFGTAVEFYANSAVDTPDYLIGELVDLRGNGTPLRWMDQPSKDGRSVDCYSSSVGRLDPHYSSGPLNHWFYLASEGSGAKTVNGVNYSSPVCGGAAAVTGAGNQAVAKVWYRALSTKLTSRATYPQAREGAIASAKELYGINSSVCLAVEKAFDGIAVPKGTQTCAR